MEWLSLLIAYLLGGIPFGFLLVKLKTGLDVRTTGSGNIGATNVHRVAGQAAGVTTLVLDGLKGWLAVWIAYRLSGGSMAWASAAAVCVLLGHIFTPFLQFKGGKGVATFLGAFSFLAPAATAAIVLIFLVAVASLRMVSLGSILAAIVFPARHLVDCATSLAAYGRFSDLLLSGLVSTSEQYPANSRWDRANLRLGKK